MKEGITEFNASSAKVVNKKMDAFYNPEMKYVRDLTIAVLNSWDKEQLRIALPLAGSGVRALRILKEVNKQKIAYVYCNDHDKTTYEILLENKEKYGDNRMFVANEEADEFLLYRKGFDYIDLDPYGSPNPYLDSAIKRISNFGIMGVTATDIKALAGTAKQGGIRKYWAEPIRGDHENGLRNLAKKIIMIGAQYDKSMIPILSISNKHYYRIFFQVKKSKTLCTELLENKFLFHTKDATAIIKELKLLNKEKINDLLLEEITSGLTDKNHFDIHLLSKKYNISQVKKLDTIIKSLKSNKYKACRSHISKTAIWTNANEEELKKVL